MLPCVFIVVSNCGLLCVVEQGEHYEQAKNCSYNTPTVLMKFLVEYGGKEVKQVKEKKG